MDQHSLKEQYIETIFRQKTGHKKWHTSEHENFRQKRTHKNKTDTINNTNTHKYTKTYKNQDTKVLFGAKKQMDGRKVEAIAFAWATAMRHW